MSLKVPTFADMENRINELACPAMLKKYTEFSSFNKFLLELYVNRKEVKQIENAYSSCVPLLEYISESLIGYEKSAKPFVFKDNRSRQLEQQVQPLKGLGKDYKKVFCWRYWTMLKDKFSGYQQAFTEDDVIQAAVEKYEDLDLSKLWYFSCFLMDYVEDAANNMSKDTQRAIDKLTTLKDSILENFGKDFLQWKPKDECKKLKITFEYENENGKKKIATANSGAIYSIGRALHYYLGKHLTEELHPVYYEDEKDGEEQIRLEGFENFWERCALLQTETEYETRANVKISFKGRLFWTLMGNLLSGMHGIATDGSAQQRLTAHIMYTIGLSDSKMLIGDSKYPLNDMKWDKIVRPKEIHNSVYISELNF